MSGSNGANGTAGNTRVEVLPDGELNVFSYRSLEQEPEKVVKFVENLKPPKPEQQVNAHVTVDDNGIHVTMQLPVDLHLALPPAPAPAPAPAPNEESFQDYTALLDECEASDDVGLKSLAARARAALDRLSDAVEMREAIAARKRLEAQAEQDRAVAVQQRLHALQQRTEADGVSSHPRPRPRRVHLEHSSIREEVIAYLRNHPLSCVSDILSNLEHLRHGRTPATLRSGVASTLTNMANDGTVTCKVGPSKNQYGKRTCKYYSLKDDNT